MGIVNFHRGPLPTDGYTIITNDEARGKLPVPLGAVAPCVASRSAAAERQNGWAAVTR